SRRRHTRFSRDWSSDVCSSDLNSVALASMAEYQYRNGHYLDARAFSQRRLDAAPATPEVLLLASQIEEKMGDNAAAARYRQRLGREFPQAAQQNPGG